MPNDIQKTFPHRLNNRDSTPQDTVILAPVQIQSAPAETATAALTNIDLYRYISCYVTVITDGAAANTQVQLRPQWDIRPGAGAFYDDMVVVAGPPLGVWTQDTTLSPNIAGAGVTYSFIARLLNTGGATDFRLQLSETVALLNPPVVSISARGGF